MDDLAIIGIDRLAGRRLRIGNVAWVSDESEYSRCWWRSLRDDLDDRYVRSKDSQRSIIELAAIYGRIPGLHRERVNEELLDWLESDDERLRYDALYIVGAYSIVEAIPRLRALQERLEVDSQPGAPYEWSKVNRILGNLKADG